MAQITVIGIGKKKGAPPPPPGPAKKRTAAPPPPPDDPNADPGADPDPDAAGQTEPDADDQGISPAEVGYGENDLCQDCANMGQDGTCTKYNFPVTETGHCLNGYEPKGGDQEPSAGGVAVAA